MLITEIKKDSYWGSDLGYIVDLDNLLDGARISVESHLHYYTDSGIWLTVDQNMINNSFNIIQKLLCG